MNTCVHNIPLNVECAMCNQSQVERRILENGAKAFQNLHFNVTDLDAVTIQLTPLEHALLGQLLIMGVGVIQKERAVPAEHGTQWIAPMKRIIARGLTTDDDNLALATVTSLLRKLS